MKKMIYELLYHTWLLIKDDVHANNRRVYPNDPVLLKCYDLLQNPENDRLFR